MTEQYGGNVIPLNEHVANQMAQGNLETVVTPDGIIDEMGEVASALNEALFRIKDLSDKSGDTSVHMLAKTVLETIGYTAADLATEIPVPTKAKPEVPPSA